MSQSGDVKTVVKKMIFKSRLKPDSESQVTRLDRACHASRFIFSLFSSLIFLFVPCSTLQAGYTSAFNCTLNTQHPILLYGH